MPRWERVKRLNQVRSGWERKWGEKEVEVYIAQWTLFPGFLEEDDRIEDREGLRRGSYPQLSLCRSLRLSHERSFLSLSLSGRRLLARPPSLPSQDSRRELVQLARRS